MTVPGCHLHILSMVNLSRCPLTYLVVFIPILLHKIQLLRCRIYRPESTGDFCKCRKHKNASLIGICDIWSLQWALRFFSAPTICTWSYPRNSRTITLDRLGWHPEWDQQPTILTWVLVELWSTCTLPFMLAFWGNSRIMVSTSSLLQWKLMAMMNGNWEDFGS